MKPLQVWPKSKPPWRPNGSRADVSSGHRRTWGPPDEVLRDEADQPVSQTLWVAQAQYLITGDKDLLELSDRYLIVTPAGFWARHGA